MPRCFEPHSEILPAAQQQIWPNLAAAAQLSFVLYGGTAVALVARHCHFGMGVFTTIGSTDTLASFFRGSRSRCSAVTLAAEIGRFDIPVCRSGFR
jgi:hypothetical protein